MNMKREFHKTT